MGYLQPERWLTKQALGWSLQNPTKNCKLLKYQRNYCRIRLKQDRSNAADLPVQAYIEESAFFPFPF